MEWYYVEDGKRAGPITESDFRQLVSSGRITQKTLVWTSGMANWVAYGSLPNTPPAPVATTVAPGICRECGRLFPRQDMVSYEGSMICAECKPKFFQRVQESAPLQSTGGQGTTPNKELMSQARTALAGKWEPSIGICSLFMLVMLTFFISMAIPFAGVIVFYLMMSPMMLGLTMYFIGLCRAQSPPIGIIWSGFRRYRVVVAVYFLRGIITGIVTLLAMLPAVMVLSASVLVGKGLPSDLTLGLADVLIIPAIAVSLSVQYMFVLCPYILVDNQSIGVLETLRQSRALMDGIRWKFFFLNFRFAGWILLCLLLSHVIIHFTIPPVMPADLQLNIPPEFQSVITPETLYQLVRRTLMGILALFIGSLGLFPYMLASYARFYDDVRGRAPAA
jgi:uncharacterized membrane protein